jgi:hypothetical protein
LNKSRTGYLPDIKRITVYFAQKMEKWKKFHGYPNNTLFILDDFAVDLLIRMVKPH